MRARPASISTVSVAPQIPVRAHFRVRHDFARHRRIGRLVDVSMAESLRVCEHGHARFVLNALDQRLAAARYDEVDQPRARQHGGDIGTVGAGRDLYCVLG